LLAYHLLLRHLQRTRSSFTLAAFVFSRVGSSYLAHQLQRSCFIQIPRHVSFAIVRGWLDYADV
jgi:tellurite resistance protein TehA-like permease